VLADAWCSSAMSLLNMSTSEIRGSLQGLSASPNSATLFAFSLLPSSLQFKNQKRVINNSKISYSPLITV